MTKMTKEKRSLLALCAVALIGSLGLIPMFFGVLRTTPVTGSLIRVACVGDSITEGSGYTRDLQNMLGAEYHVRNFGVSGSTVLASSDRPYMCQKEYKSSQIFLPEIVVIMLGTNDARANLYYSINNFSVEYTKMITDYQALVSNPEIWLVTPPPISENELDLKNLNLEQKIIPQIEQVANELNLPTIDVNSILTGHPEYLMDGVHPSREGATIIASAVSQAITINGTKIAQF